jgi:uncharacterized BrkB/YihY/UPF0761 family membrane protein
LTIIVIYFVLSKQNMSPNSQSGSSSEQDPPVNKSRIYFLFVFILVFSALMIVIILNIISAKRLIFELNPDWNTLMFQILAQVILIASFVLILSLFTWSQNRSIISKKSSYF